jgi:hypothetical protein
LLMRAWVRAWLCGGGGLIGRQRANPSVDFGVFMRSRLSFPSTGCTVTGARACMRQRGCVGLGAAPAAGSRSDTGFVCDGLRTSRASVSHGSHRLLKISVEPSHAFKSRRNDIKDSCALPQHHATGASEHTTTPTGHCCVLEQSCFHLEGVVRVQSRCSVLHARWMAPRRVSTSIKRQGSMITVVSPYLIGMNSYLNQIVFSCPVERPCVVAPEGVP